MPPKVAPPKPRLGQQRRPLQRQRIEGLGSSPGPRTFRASTPSIARQSTPGRSTPGPSGRTIRRCPNPNCPQPHIVMANDISWVCETCGTIAEQESNLVGEAAFTEAPNGKTSLQGQTVSYDQTHQKTYGIGPGLGAAGREPTANREKSERDAKRAMVSYCVALRIDSVEADMAMRIFKLAWTNRFIQGRGLENTAAVSLYLALRRRTIQEFGIVRPKYPIMLIDLAEILNVDVFALGKMYTDLVRKLYLDTATGGIIEHESASLLAYGPEVLIDKFVDALEFSDNARRVKEDAIRIVARMKRDWMSTGRRPAGVCGAAVILAARMNNHRRTTREVILVAKVTEITLNKRLEEFKDLPSSTLSVNEFRDNDILDSISAADPPAYQRAQNPDSTKKKRGRPRKQRAPETAAEIEGDGDEPPAKRARVDAEGFAIPDLPLRQTPIDPNLTNTDSSQESTIRNKGPGRPPGAKNWRAPPASAAELAIEAELERDVLETLRDNPEFDPNHEIDTDSGSPPQLPTPDATQPEPASEQEPEPASDPSTNPVTQVFSNKDPPGPPVNSSIGNTGNISLSPTLKPDEFDDDPDVSACLLSEAERQLKETVWVNANADWLRQDHAKRIKRELKEAELREKGIDPSTLTQHGGSGGKKGGVRKRKDGTRRAGRLGDVSYLNDPEPGREGSAGDGGNADGEQGAREGSATGAGGDTLESSTRDAAEAVRKMLSHRGTFSRKINYDIVDRLYGVSASPNGSDSRSRSRTNSQSVSVDNREREESVFVPAEENAQPVTPRSKMSLAAEKREKKKRETRQAAAATGKDSAGGSGSGSASPSTPVQDPSGNTQRATSTGEPSSQTTTPTTPTHPAPQPQPQAQTRTPPSTSTISTVHLPEEELVGPVPSSTSNTTTTPEHQEDLDEEESLIQPRPLSSTPQGEADEIEESEGDEDDYVDNEEDEDADADVDVDAAFEGTYTAPPRRGWED